MIANIEVQRAAWLEERKSGLGGSDAAVAIGRSPWKSRYELWGEKVGLIEAPDLSGKEEVEWGLRLEEPIAKAVTERSGRKVDLAAPFTISRSPSVPFMLATLDGRLFDEERGEGVLQIKTTGAQRVHDWDEQPPLHYVIQVQHEMAVAGLAWACLAVLIGGQKLRWFDVPRNQRFIAAMIEEEAAFWELVQTETPPDVDGTEGCKEALKALFPEDKGQTIAMPPAAVDWDDDLCTVKLQIKALQEEKDLLENKMKAALGSAAYGVLSSGERYSYKSQTISEHVVREHTKRPLVRLTK